jgi:hypothetical protein
MRDLLGQEVAQTMIAGAEFSSDREYRYALWRIWDKSKTAGDVHRTESFDR